MRRDLTIRFPPGVIASTCDRRTYSFPGLTPHGVQIHYVSVPTDMSWWETLIMEDDPFPDIGNNSPAWMPGEDQ